MAALAYHVISKEVKNNILIHNWIFRHTCCINNPHWQISGIIIFLCKYYIVISDTLVGSFLDVLFLLLAVILSEFHEKPIQNKDEVTEIEVPQIDVRNINFLIPRPSFYCIICYFLCIHHPLSQVNSLLNGLYKDAWYCHGWYSLWYHE